MDRMFVNLDQYGNTSAASVPIALAEAVNEGRVKVGDRIVIVAFGAGFTSGAVAIEWTADPARGIAGDAAVEPEDVSVRLPVDWDSVDPIPEALAELMRRPGPVDVPLDDVVPGEPEHGRRGGPRMIDLTGKTALVTGGSRGHRAGDRAPPRDPGRGRRVQLPGQRGGRGRDGRRRSRRSAAGRSRSRATRRDPDVGGGASSRPSLEAFGKVDILVNNAGITRDDLIMRMSQEAWREVLETNLFGAFYMTKAVTRPMLKARGGRIINITSVSGQAGQMGQANYSSAKAGLIGLTKATARELASRAITVNAVAPGLRPDRADPGPARGAQGRDHGADAARPVRRRPRRSPTRSRSSPATRPRSSPARCSPSTAAW